MFKYGKGHYKGDRSCSEGEKRGLNGWTNEWIDISKSTSQWRK